MICPLSFVDMLRERGIGLATGVPCSYLTGLINTVISHPEFQYIGATNEGDAVAIACGAELGGKKAAVLFQNSGFGNAVSPLTSLTSTFQIPALLLCTWRGNPDGPSDEPQHRLMGQITPQLFDLIGIPWQQLPERESDVPHALDRAVLHMTQNGLPFAMLIRKGQFAHRPLDGPSGAPATKYAEPPNHGDHEVTHDADDVLRTVQSSLTQGDAVIATTGYTGRALYGLGDRPNQFYMVGSMGCASSMGLGLAWAQPKRKVFVLDGDGAFQMRMGALAALGHERPCNLVHVLLDNGVHDSTGAQCTYSESTDPVLVARACGYPRALRVGSLNGLASVLRQSSEAMTLLHVKTRPRSDRNLPRPRVTPVEVAERFRQWIQQS